MEPQPSVSCPPQPASPSDPASAEFTLVADVSGTSGHRRTLRLSLYERRDGLLNGAQDLVTVLLSERIAEGRYFLSIPATITEALT